ncbi:MAG TPA: multicopper oxidase domain-containing protein [Candidatus Limnocylindrales bacterium]|nr:multicopper oxidase domain-containing protein [Candidatus Limnocylindrales bacterium]
MDIDLQPADGSLPPSTTIDQISASTVSRRALLRAAGGGLVAVGVAACAGPTPTSGWLAGPSAKPASSGAPAASGAPSQAASAGPSASAAASASAAPSMDHSPAPSGAPAADHDANALAVVKRFLDGEGASLKDGGNQPFEPKVVDGVKVFELTVEEISHLIDAKKDPVKALGFAGTWPGPRLTVTEGDKVRAVFTNKMSESTGIHFHGQKLPNAMDGVPHITQDPIQPGASFTYEFTARTPGSHMYHSHHNATDQVGRGLLGAFIVEPKDPAKRYDKLYGVTQDIVWISNDALGGFTINGRGFPATSPIVAKLGEKIVIRFMNEGNMMHPWHLHGMPMHVVARDGYPLGGAAFTCDTLGVNPGERWDVVVDCTEPGAWAFHCHILQHAEGPDGMFGMVTALVVQQPSASISDATVVAEAARAAGSTAFACRVPQVG